MSERIVSVWASKSRVVLDPDKTDKENVVFSLTYEEAREWARMLFEQSLSKEEARRISKELLGASEEVKAYLLEKA